MGKKGAVPSETLFGDLQGSKKGAVPQTKAPQTTVQSGASAFGWFLGWCAGNYAEISAMHLPEFIAQNGPFRVQNPDSPVVL